MLVIGFALGANSFALMFLRIVKKGIYAFCTNPISHLNTVRIHLILRRLDHLYLTLQQTVSLVQRVSLPTVRAVPIRLVYLLAERVPILAASVQRQVPGVALDAVVVAGGGEGLTLGVPVDAFIALAVGYRVAGVAGGAEASAGVVGVAVFGDFFALSIFVVVSRITLITEAVRENFAVRILQSPQNTITVMQAVAYVAASALPVLTVPLA